jgi:toxin ParE1/3/4
VKRVTFAPAARSDLLSIANYIAADNQERAVTFIDEIEKRCLKLGSFPDAARGFPALGADAHIVPFKRYVILYRNLAGEVSIERIIHGARDVMALVENI